MTKFKITEEKVKGGNALALPSNAIYSKAWILQSLNMYNTMIDLVDQIEVMHGNMNTNLATELTIKQLQALLFLDMKKLETQKDFLEEREKHGN